MKGIAPKKHLLRFWLGLAVSLQLGLFLVGGVLVAPKPTAAEAVVPTCFLKAECIDLNEAAGGNCDDQHCFEQGGGCTGTAGRCYAKWPEQELTVDIGVTKVANLGDYLVKLYDAGFAIAGFLAAVMMIIGGLFVATAGGNDTNVSKGKTIIKNALVGLFIAAGAFVILQTVNPALVELKLPKILVVKKQRLGQCKGIEQCVPCGERFIALLPKNTKDDLGGGLTGGWVDLDCSNPAVKDRIMKFGEEMTDALAAKYDEGPECVGKSCQLANSGCKDDSHKCVLRPAGVADPNNCGKGTGSTTAQIVCEPIPGSGASATYVAAGTACPAGTKSQAAGTPAPADNNEYYCKECIANGSSGCTVVAGESDECCSGFCTESIGKARSAAGLTSGLGVCSNGDFGAPCASDTHCKTGLCNEDWFSGRCVTGLVGSPCANNDDCKSGNYCSDWNHLCTPGNEYNYCDTDDNCKGDLKCQSVETLWSGVGAVAGAAANTVTGCSACDLPSVKSVVPSLCAICSSGSASVADQANWLANGKFKVCMKPGAKFSTCNTCSMIESAKSLCTVPLVCPALINGLKDALNCNTATTSEGCPESAPYCSDAIGRACTTGAAGTPCTKDDDCASRKCGGCEDSRTCNKVCTRGKAIGEACSSDGDCKGISGAANPQCVCNDSDGQFRNICACTTGSLGSPCNKDDDCGDDPRNPSKKLVCRNNSCGIAQRSDGL